MLDLGKRLEPLAEADYAEHNKVKGCQSQVWMVAELDRETGHMRIRADSDAFIVKGLIALLLRLYANRRRRRSSTTRPRCSTRSGSARTSARPGPTVCTR